MPRALDYALTWSQEHARYELSIHGQVESTFQPKDEPAFARWLEAQTAFAFRGRAGPLSVIKEGRGGQIGYWYAYRTQARQTHKRYLGATDTLSLARLEETAKSLSQEYERQAKVRASSFSQPPSLLLRSQLAPPRLPPTLVSRSRLLTELDAGLTSPLLLVSASVGSGKTTLLAAWIATLVRERKRAERRKGERGEREDAAPPEVVWLALDPLDNTVIRFWSSVIAALRTVVPEIGQTALALLHAAETSPLSIILTHLLSEVELSGRKLLLILDDYHLISEQSIIDSMLFLLDHLPANLHLVLSTRTDPELPLTRLRVRSQLVEIRDRDLRFTEEETARFLREGMGLPLDTSEVA